MLERGSEGWNQAFPGEFWSKVRKWYDEFGFGESVVSLSWRSVQRGGPNCCIGTFQ